MGYILRRFLQLFVTLFAVALMVFSLVHMIPGDPAVVMMGENASKEDLIFIREALGLDKPLYIQFRIWMGRVLSGNLGTSIRSHRPVIQSIRERFPVTLILTTLAMIFSMLISLPFGILAAVHQNTGKDYFFMLATTFGMSVPTFWLGLMGLLIFSMYLGWFPSSGFVPMWEDFWAGLRYMVLPAVTLGLYMAAVVSRMIRSSMLEVLRLEYITHARAKGLSEYRVLTKHALKNAFAPTLTIIGIQYGMLLGGSVVTELVFSLPGLGKFLVGSIFARDYPAVQGCILFIALVYAIINLTVDILYPYFDPRIEYE